MLSAGTSKFKSEKEDLGTGSVISSSKKTEENGKKNYGVLDGEDDKKKNLIQRSYRVKNIQIGLIKKWRVLWI